MESHSRWLVRIGAFILGLYPYVGYVLHAAEERGFHLPPSWSPGGTLSLYEVRFNPLSSFAVLLYLALPVLATFPAFRNHAWLRRIQVGLLLLLCLTATRLGSLGPETLPLLVRIGIPLLAAGWIVALMVLAFDEDRVGRWGRALTSLVLLTELVLSGIDQPRWLAIRTGLPIGMAGAAIMAAGELLYPWPKTPEPNPTSSSP